MAVISDICGHCGIDAAQEIVSEYGLRRSGRSPIVAIFTRCQSCSLPGYAIVQREREKGPSMPSQSSADIGFDGWTVAERGPRPKVPTAPDHLPEQVERAFLQAVTAAGKAEMADATIMLCRRTLEVATQHLGEPSGTLAARIRRLADDGRITRDLADWCDHIRVLGNDAVHADRVLGKEGHDQARELLEFTRLVLMYLFTLPGLVQAARHPAAD